MNFSIRLSTAFIAGLVIIAVLFFATFIWADPSPIANGTTALLGLALAVLMALALAGTRKRASFDLIVVLTFSMFIYFFPRIFQYLHVRQENLKLLYLLFPMNWTQADINGGLTYVVIGTFLMVLGIIGATYAYYRFGKSRENSDIDPEYRVPSLASLILSGVLIYGVDGYYTIYRGMSASSNCQFDDLRAKWLIHFFSGDIYIFAVIALLLPKFGKLAMSYRVYLFASILIYLFYTLLLGSRGGTLRLLVVVFSLLIAFSRDYRVKLRNLLTFVPSAAALAVGLFFVGTSIREYKRDNCGETLSMGRKGIDNEIFGYEADQKFVGRFKNDSRNTSKIALPPRYAQICDRMGIIDYALGIVSMPADESVKDTYINFSYPARNLTNNMVPGVPFPEAQLMTNNMMPLLYRKLTFKHIQENFLSEPFTIWGLAFIYFGYFGGFVFLLFSAGALQGLYLWGTHRLKNWGFLYKGYFLWAIANGAYYFNMGFDHAALVYGYGIFQCAVTFGAIFGIDRLILKRKETARVKAALQG